MEVNEITQTRVNKVIYIVTFVIITIISTSNILAAELNKKDKAVVILIDTSGSMNANDNNRLAMDSLMQLISSLPSYYQVGVVAYSDEIVLNTKLVSSDNRQEIIRKMNALVYDGYSNAAVGVSEAIELLQGIKDSHIIMLSDGEILLESEQSTINANSVFKKETQRAKESGIKVHFIGLADEILINGEISKISEQTDGSKYYAIGGKDIQDVINNILTNQLMIKKVSLGIINTNNETIESKIDIPQLDKVNILLTSNGLIDPLKLNFETESANQIRGDRYTSIILDKPKEDTIDIALNSKGNQVKIYAIPEQTVNIETDVKYSDILNPEGTKYIRTANIEVSFKDENLKEIDCSQENIVLTVNGLPLKEYEYISDSTISFKQNVDEDKVLDIKVDESSFSFNTCSISGKEVFLEKPELVKTLPAESKAETNSLGLISKIVLAVVIVGGAIILLIKIHNDNNNNLDKTIIKNTYTGRLNIYIKRTLKDIDLPPLTFNLFVISDGRDISLEYVLVQLKIKETFKGAENIYFSPGQGHELKVINNSESTLINKGEILLRNSVARIDYESDVDIYFEDGVSEIQLQYKNNIDFNK